MQNTWLWIVVVVVVVVGGFIWWQSAQSSSTAVDLTPTTDQTADTVPTNTDTSSTGTSTSTPTDGDTTADAPMSAAVTYTDSGFSPATVTIKKGGSVTFTDEKSGSMWVASAPHPAHTGYDGTSRTTHCAPGYTGAAPFDQCAPGASYTFTFDKTGTWPYHDHMDASAFGKIVVVE